MTTTAVTSMNEKSDARSESRKKKKQIWNQQFGVGELNLILFNHGTEGKSCPFSGSIITWYIVYYFRIF